MPCPKCCAILAVFIYFENKVFNSSVLRETPQLLDLYLTKSVLADIYLAKMQSNWTLRKESNRPPHWDDIISEVNNSHYKIHHSYLYAPVFSRDISMKNFSLKVGRVTWLYRSGWRWLAPRGRGPCFNLILSLHMNDS